MTTDAIVSLEQLQCIKHPLTEARTEPYIWPALIRVDDNTLAKPELVDIVTPALGHARTIIKDSMREGETVAIPPQVGILRTRFEANLTTRVLILVVALLEMDETPKHAMQAGFLAFNDELPAAIVANLFALDAAERIEDEEQREAEKKRIIKIIQGRVEDRVKSTIENNLSGWEKARVFAGTLNLDDSLGSDFISLVAHNFIIPVRFTMLFEATEKLIIVEGKSKYKIQGQLQLRPVEVDRCQSQINAVNAAQDAVNDIEKTIADLQAQLSGGGDEPPLPAKFLRDEIDRLREEELIPAVAALGAARNNLRFCRIRQGVVGGPRENGVATAQGATNVPVIGDKPDGDTNHSTTLV
jgi:hypothetical protein